MLDCVIIPNHNFHTQDRWEIKNNSLQERRKLMSSYFDQAKNVFRATLSIISRTTLFALPPRGPKINFMFQER